MLLSLVTGLYLAAGIYLLGRRRAGFSHRRNTISELGERGAADAQLASWGLFFPVGSAMALVWFLNRHSSPQAATLAAVIAVGYVGAVLFPCDPGSPASGSASQGMHNLTGGIQYVGGIVRLLALGRDSVAFLVLGGAVALCVPLISLPFGIPVRGIAQRIAEACLIGGLVLALATRAVV